MKLVRLSGGLLCVALTSSVVRAGAPDDVAALAARIDQLIEAGHAENGAKAGAVGRRRRVRPPRLSRRGRTHPARRRDTPVPRRYVTRTSAASSSRNCSRGRNTSITSRTSGGRLAACRRTTISRCSSCRDRSRPGCDRNCATTSPTTRWCANCSPPRSLSTAAACQAHRRQTHRRRGLLPGQREQAGEPRRRHVAACFWASNWNAPSATITPSPAGAASSSGNTPPSSPASARSSRRPASSRRCSTIPASARSTSPTPTRPCRPASSTAQEPKWKAGTSTARRAGRLDDGRRQPLFRQGHRQSHVGPFLRHRHYRSGGRLRRGEPAQPSRTARRVGPGDGPAQVRSEVSHSRHHRQPGLSAHQPHDRLPARRTPGCSAACRSRG